MINEHHRRALLSQDTEQVWQVIGWFGFFLFFFLRFIYFYYKERYTESRSDREEDLPFDDSLPKLGELAGAAPI